MKPTKEELAERLEKRLKRLTSCTTPEEMAFDIWSKNLEEAMQSSRKEYRDGFINWVECYKSDTKKPMWKYKTPEELANAIWQPYLDEPKDTWFPALREALVLWINAYHLSKFYPKV